MNKRKIIICSIIVMIVASVGGGLFYLHHKSVQDKIAAVRQNKIDKINEKRSTISDDLSRYTTLRDDIGKNMDRLAKADTAITNLHNDAIENGNLRHDEALSAYPNSFKDLGYAKAELADIDSVRDNLEEYEKAFAEFSDICLPILGEDALRTYNTDYKSYIADSRMAYSRWHEAAQDVVNELILITERRFYNNSEDNTAGLYRDSSDAHLKAQSDLANVTADSSKIQKEVDGHISRDNASLDALVYQFSLL